MKNFKIRFMERNRSQTEERLIDGIEEMIKEQGFEQLGVRAVAERAGVDKKLIYRYFGSLDGLIYECLKRHDFWSNVTTEIPESIGVNDYIKGMFRKQIEQFRSNEISKRLLRWELSNVNEFVLELRNQREETGMKRIEEISKLTNIPVESLASISSIITGGICYLVMLEETCHYFNAIDIQSNDGWEQLINGINNIIDLMYNNGN